MKIRIAGKLLMLSSFTLPMMAAQSLAMKTGWWSDRVLPHLWHRAALKVLGIRVRIVGRPARERPLLIVSNHVSWSDILILGSVTGLHFISKAEVRNWPVMGTFARMQRSIFIERERRQATADQVQEIAQRLTSGDPMVLFAEGTTGDGNRLLPFKSALFGAARLALPSDGGGSLTVQPVAIVYRASHGLLMDRRERTELAWIGDTDFVPHLMKIMNKGNIEVEVRFGEPLSFAADADRKTMARETEASIRELLRGDGPAAPNQ